MDFHRVYTPVPLILTPHHSLIHIFPLRLKPPNEPYEDWVLITRSTNQLSITDGGIFIYGTRGLYHGQRAPINRLFAMARGCFNNISDTYCVRYPHVFSSYSTKAPRIQLERPARSQHMSGAHENSSGSHAGYVYGDSVTSTSATPNQHHIRPGPVTSPQHDYTAPRPGWRRPQRPCQQPRHSRQPDVTLGSTASHGT